MEKVLIFKMPPQIRGTRERNKENVIISNRN